MAFARTRHRVVVTQPQICTSIRRLKTRLSRVHRLEVPQDRTPVPVVGLVVGTALARRVADLGAVALDLADRRHIVAASILIRACMETSALVWWLAKQLDAAIDARDAPGLKDFVARVLAGSRPKGTTLLSPRVGHAIKAVNADREYAGFSDLYSLLCETAHPNTDGVMASYAATKTDGRVRFLRRRRSLNEVECLAVERAVRMTLDAFACLQSCVPKFRTLEATMNATYTARVGKHQASAT